MEKGAQSAFLPSEIWWPQGDEEPWGKWSTWKILTGWNCQGFILFFKCRAEVGAFFVRQMFSASFSAGLQGSRFVAVSGQRKWQGEFLALQQGFFGLRFIPQSSAGSWERASPPAAHLGVWGGEKGKKGALGSQWGDKKGHIYILLTTKNSRKHLFTLFQRFYDTFQGLQGTLPAQAVPIKNKNYSKAAGEGAKEWYLVCSLNFHSPP